MPINPSRRLDPEFALIRMDRPDIFAREDFQKWLNDPKNLAATWHSKGPGIAPSEYSDVFTVIDGDYDGTDRQTMPDEVWQMLADEVRRLSPSGKALVWLVNAD
jgi:hypothetical protein